MLMHNKGCGKNDAEKNILDLLRFTIAQGVLAREGDSEKIEEEKDKIVELLVEFVKNIFSFKSNWFA